ncbi:MULTISPECIES: dihydrodipicolinate synthase family protein [Devosia]|jgi:1-pyrroline-4-hydroxy-2-carboxylate deaminase|uniref:Dihydrodipicolinate synthase family protein n=1 Tax=Devosia litorisediminis TaxID=2829817 RepID=A0A942EEN7_9HYPH|nr:MULTISPECIES: dihydrodipicolinate synthase family protein [Devosia]MBS3849859.1 dihydrodipicolinate synthase family protein [Devosia litorisediminis]MCZ4346858.1 dihydrodipicolinate synthase family protein [Devosia neptuniae]
MTVNWQGVIPALMTEMKQDGALDMPSTAKHVESSLKAGCEGFIMLGTLGENSSLSLDEKELVVRTAVEASNGRAPVIAGIAEYTTDLAIETANRLKKAGADGIMALPTMVYQQDAREAVEHFKKLAQAVDLPMMIYNNHVAYKVDLLPEDFVGLNDQKNIVAVKESSHDSRRITDMINVLGDRYKLFCGVDDLMLENVLFGAVGWVSGMTNSFPNEAVQMYKLAKAGRVEEALAIYRWFMPVLHLDTKVKLVQYIKLANQMAGEGAEWVRAPRLPLIGEERKMIEKIVQTAIDTRPTLAAL